ncbi:MAG TPA: universal stress protein [Bacteroidia bacterium]|nr:universal stress protein [Bacteroidia bacterium]
MQEAKKNNTILVPTDFSEVATNALEHAVTIARIYGNEILLLHIVEESFLGSLFGSKNAVKEGLVGQMLQDKLDEICKKITAENGVKARGIIREGRIYKTILEVSEEIDCDSIVMGTNGAEGFERVMGSNSSKVIAQSEFPVVVVKEKKIGQGYKNIVFPVDLTLESKQKTWWAMHVAKKFDSTIHIIAEKESDEFFKNRMVANLRSIEDVFNKNGVKHTTTMLDDDKYPDKFYMDTLRYADEINADLIMIMTQQEKGFSEFLIGSYAQQIVNAHSKIPVMCIVPRNTGLVPVGWSMS